MVQAPVTKSLYQLYGNNPEFDKEMRSLGEYYNFNSLVSLNDSLHFYDPDHLNSDGVKIFNKALINTVLRK